jgi:acetyl-CoA synthetase
MAYGLEYIENKNLGSLKVLGTVGEPINEEAWHWYHEHIGKGKCPVVDTWWQTETGGILISNLAGVTPQKPAHATFPLPGVQPVLLNEKGKIIKGSDAAANALSNSPANNGLKAGNLCIKFPWPGMIRTTYGDHERCRQNYFQTYPGLYFTGDGCLMDENGYYRITGRVDDVLNISGHRIGTAEVENAIDQYPGVVESAVVGFPHEIKGQGIYAYVIMPGAMEDEDRSRQAIVKSVAEIIGAFARPDKIQFVNGLPKTRSGKIMRRILRKIAEGEMDSIGDTTTLLDPAVVDEIVTGKL